MAIPLFDTETPLAPLRAQVLERVAEVIDEPADSGAARVAAWSIVHGFAALWLGGALPPDIGTDPEAAARPVLRLLFGPAAA